MAEIEQSAERVDMDGDIRVVVYKALRLLEVWHFDRLLASMPVALGREPVGHKCREGDGKTPEGSYRACVRNAGSKFHRSIGIDYPNRQDADEGLAGGLISREQRDHIVAALDAGSRPPWDTALGGEIMIHGGGIASDWTAGCIALEDREMDLLWELVPMGTEIRILP